MRDHSRSSTISGAAGSRRRKALLSVRKASAKVQASRRSSLAPAGDQRSRKRSSCLGLMAWIVKPRSIRVSTTGPCGTSMATPTSCGCALISARSQSVISASPVPLCWKDRCPTVLPSLSTTQT